MIDSLRDRTLFRQYLLDGVHSKPVGRMDAAYFESLRQHVKNQPGPRRERSRNPS